MNASKLKTLILSICATSFAISLISFPKESMDASIRGLNMWWEIVFPSLLPFFIISEMLIGFGVVKFIGVLLEPLMRPLFRVPGIGGFVWAMGMASGFPAGAKLTARLRQERQITRAEGERLVSFTNSSNPLFIFGAVSVGFFYNPNLGIMLALAHYLGNFMVGLTMRFYGNDRKQKKETKNHFSIKHAFSVLHQTRIKDERPIGKLLGDAVISSIQTLLMIGGFIILFSVINKLLFHLHITSFLAKAINYFFHLFGLPSLLSIPFISGLFEITLGSQLTSQVQGVSLLQQAVIVSFILAFSGFSVQAQVASILAQTDIQFKPFFFARILHGFYSAIIMAVLWKPVYEHFYENGETIHSIPVFIQGNAKWWEVAIHWLQNIGPLLTISALIIYILIYARRNLQN
ncbi:sporulation integral membrane protein YlbJ [Oikeobacillus pervagus]|uniref:Sporulation integral membrane protein YlbJ n=1 Tax=Oikeobacillus pervagus TaxID=1325931 RepID=A0AAJ1WKK4_9BACI|nr:sporulation integral membrane protein YlbJ [Oikeobacillus pervagus]MDQ0215221.1 sporulation integral membrane protein YlbJ [Oikeobacillus pervagus]